MNKNSKNNNICSNISIVNIMKLAQKIPITFLFVIIATTILSFVKNKSNFPSTIMIPIIVALLTKYALGDWDVGYAWTYLDIFYWGSILTISYTLVRLAY
jgi:hypothetical protein